MKNTLNNATVRLRPANERGHVDHGWLDSYHTFSFAGYQDRNHMGFRALRVINEDRVAPGMGFGAHPHQDMEIFSYVVEGSLTHKDSMGNEFTITSGRVQKITAGKGITHSEFNASKKDKAHFLQIWIIPGRKGLKPSYQEYAPQPLSGPTPVVLIGSPEGGENVIQFNQDVYIYKGQLSAGKSYEHELKKGRGVWLQLIKGDITLNDHQLSSGDGASVENVNQLDIKAQEDAEFLLIDLS